MTLAESVAEARRLALAPEQSLLRMISQRRASRRALADAVASYRAAADVLDTALAALSSPPKESQS